MTDDTVQVGLPVESDNELLTTTEMSEEDQLKALLQVDGAALPTSTGSIKRLGIRFKIFALREEDIVRLRSQATRTMTNRRGSEEKFNTVEFNRALCVKGTDIPFGAAALMKKYGAAEPVDVVAKMLLAGEQINLAEAILNVSGYFTEIEDLKNE